VYFLAFCIPFFAQHGVDFISLIAPTSANRIAMITREARGFIYVVSSLGVAGERAEITADVSSLVATIRENTSVPCAVGFGISIPQQAHDMAAISDGAIVGSAIIRLLEQYGTEAPAHIGAFVKSMKDAL
jgi:tryptophan synthase, alpha subunit